MDRTGSPPARPYQYHLLVAAFVLAMRSTRFAISTLEETLRSFRTLGLPRRLWPEIEQTFIAIMEHVPREERPRFLGSCLLFHAITKSIPNADAFRVVRERLSDPVTHEPTVGFINSPNANWAEYEEACAIARARVEVIETSNQLMIFQQLFCGRGALIRPNADAAVG